MKSPELTAKGAGLLDLLEDFEDAARRGADLMELRGAVLTLAEGCFVAPKSCRRCLADTGEVVAATEVGERGLPLCESCWEAE